MAGHYLGERALNRALLARQGLLEPLGGSIPEVVERICGIQMQYAPSGYIGLWSRMRSFKRDDLTKALEQREVVQATSLRATIHLLTPRDYALFGVAIARTRKEWWKRATRHSGLDEEASLEQLVALLRQEPRKRDELMKELAVTSTTWNGLQMWVDMVRVPPSGTWGRRRADIYGLAAWWLGGNWKPEIDEPTAIGHLVGSYLRGFGPASTKDIAAFTGLSVNTLKPVLAALSLRSFESEAGELVDIEDGLLPDPDTPSPIRFLPVWDASLLVHARRTQILPEPYRPLVFDIKTPHSINTFLVDGRVAGTWKLDKDRVRLEHFEHPTASTSSRVAAEADRLFEFLR
ncbi:MAG: winged helix DNA-binding domain-containing protein [Actinomycetota bacterium]